MSECHVNPPTSYMTLKVFMWMSWHNCYKKYFEHMIYMLVEGDVKVCFDVLSREEELTDQFMSIVISNTFYLSLYFVICEFC